MTRDLIEATLFKAMEEEFEIETKDLVLNARIRDDLGLDSLDVVDLVVVLEAAFKFKIRDKAALLKIETLGDVADFIENTATQAEDERKTCALQA